MKLKKALAVVLSTMMVAGMAVTGMAGSNDATLKIGNGIANAYCDVSCGATYADANTDVYTTVDCYHIYASTSVTYTGTSAAGKTVTLGSDSDSITEVSGYVAFASVYVSGNLSKLAEYEASSSHDAEVNDYTPVYTGISAYHYNNK